MGAIARSLLGLRTSRLLVAQRSVHQHPFHFIAVNQTRPLFANQSPWNSPTLQAHCHQRQFSAHAPLSTRYRRFGQPSTPSSDGRRGDDQLTQTVKQLINRNGSSYGGARTIRGFDDRAKLILFVVVAGGGTYYLVHLEQVPGTGRWRFIDVGTQMEKELGEQTFRQVLQSYQGQILPSSHPAVQMVIRVAGQIVAAAKSYHEQGDIDAKHLPWAGGQGDGSNDRTSRDQTEWQVFVINSQEKNAFVLPNGKIFVFAGILPICKDADGLATVLGHEVAHQVLRHSAEKVSGTKVLYAISILLSTLIGDTGGLSYALSQYIYGLPNSRTVEIEADRVGLRLMSAACFDPTKAPEVWERMEKGEEHGAISDFFASIGSTHPLSGKRMAKMKEWLPEAQQIREDAGCPSKETLAGFRSASGDGGVAAFPRLRSQASYGR